MEVAKVVCMEKHAGYVYYNSFINLQKMSQCIYKPTFADLCIISSIPQSCYILANLFTRMTVPTQRDLP